MNLYDFKAPTTGEIFDTIFQNRDIKIVRIVSSDDIDETLYIQDDDEWVVVINGYALLDIDGERIELLSGDNIFIPKLTPHRVLKIEDKTLWLALHISTNTP